MRMPVDELMSNWAYMVMTALAWNLKAWYGLLMPNRKRGLEIVRMEFRRFLRHRFASGADHPHGKANCLPALKLERMDGRFFPHLGTAAIDVSGRVNPLG